MSVATKTDLDLESASSTASLTPPVDAALASPPSDSFANVLATSLSKLASALEASLLDNPEDAELKRQERLFLRFTAEVLTEGGAKVEGATTEVWEETEVLAIEGGESGESGEDAERAFGVIEAADREREETLRAFNSTLEKALADKDVTLRHAQHEHEETMRRLIQGHEETIRHMTHEREETNRRIVTDIASMVRVERQS